MDYIEEDKIKCNKVIKHWKKVKRFKWMPLMAFPISSKAMLQMNFQVVQVIRFRFNQEYLPYPRKQNVTLEIGTPGDTFWGHYG